MSEAQVDPHDTMRARDVNRMARGEQAPRPAREPGTISDAPERPTGEFSEKDLRTAPSDIRFPTTNQMRHCYTRYIEYHRCIRAKGTTPDCEKFARYYRSLCPSEWIEKWNEQLELGIFPGPL